MTRATSRWPWARLLALEALYDDEEGQRAGWLAALKGLAPGVERRAALGPSRLNVTPPFAGLILSLWGRRLGRETDGEPFPVATTAAALSAKADGLIWGQARPAVLLGALALALAAGDRSGFWIPWGAPILWAALVIGLQIWGIRRGRTMGDADLVRWIGSASWGSWTRRAARVRLAALGTATGIWIVRGSPTGDGPDGPWIGLPLVGAFAAWRIGVRPSWGIAAVALAWAAGWLAARFGAAP
jgi:hypothetical protein